MLIFKAPKTEYKGCLHLHTDQSDGLLPPLEAVQAYEAAGYDFIAITDHRRITLADGYTGPMLVLPGIEINQAKRKRRSSTSWPSARMPPCCAARMTKPP